MTILQLGVVGQLKREVQELKQRVAALEAAQQLQPAAYTFENSLRLNDSQSGPYHSSASPSQQPPWTSKSIRLTEQLTSSDFAVKAQLGQALLLTLVGLFLGAVITTVFNLVWYAAILIGLAVGALALTILILDHRGLVHRMVSGDERRQAKKQALRVTVKHEQPEQPSAQYKTLFLNGQIDRDDLRLMAQEVTQGKSLAVHGWTGVGGWTLGKVTNFMTELEKMGYATPGNGNKPRQLTRKGKALFRALAGD